MKSQSFEKRLKDSMTNASLLADAADTAMDLASTAGADAMFSYAAWAVLHERAACAQMAEEAGYPRLAKKILAVGDRSDAQDPYARENYDC